MSVWGIVFNVVLLLLVIATVLCLGGAGYMFVKSRTIDVGTIVQMEFYGNVAYLSAALYGPKAEVPLSFISQQDMLNHLYCDVPGSAGAYSSWFRPAGQNAPNDPTTQANPPPAFWNTAWTCDQTANCTEMPWLQCGFDSACFSLSAAEIAAGIPPPTEWDQNTANTCCGNAEGKKGYAVCSLTGDGTAHGVCVTAPASDVDGQPLYSCNGNNQCVPTVQSISASPETCGVWGNARNGVCSNVAQGACNLAKQQCVNDVGEHVMLNTPWIAQGVVSSINSDGSVNVQWTRIANRYATAGPQLSWFPPDFQWNYQNCSFISSGSASSDPTSLYNEQVTLMALGLGASGMDVGGLPVDGGTLPVTENVWALTDPTLGYGWMGATPPNSGSGMQGLPTIGMVGSQSSAWNLTAISLSTDALTPISAYTIQPVPATPWNLALLASMSEYHCTYMGDRPPHLQISPAALSQVCPSSS